MHGQPLHPIYHGRLERRAYASYKGTMRIVITGANRGIGLALAELYIGRGDEVHAGARQPAQARALAALRAESNGRLTIHELDVRNEASCRALGEALAGVGV